MEKRIFDFLCKKYVQCADMHEKSMNLQYMVAETHDLAREILALYRQFLKEEWQAYLNGSLDKIGR